MTGYTMMPLNSKSIATPADNKGHHHAMASNNALNQITESNGKNAPLPSNIPPEVLNSRKKSHELRLGSSSYAKKPNAFGYRAVDGDNKNRALF